MNSKSKLLDEQKEFTYQIIFKNSSESKLIIDQDGIIIDANEAFCKDIGKKRNNCIGINVYSILSPDIATKWKGYAEEAFRTENRLIFEDFRNGQFFRHSLYPVAGYPSSTKTLYIFIQDITDIKIAELKNNKHTAFSKEAMEAFPGAFTVLDSKGKIISCNSYLRNLIVKNENDDPSGLNTFDLFHPDQVMQLHGKLKNILENGAEETAEVQIRLHGGPEYRWFKITTKRVIVDNEIFLISAGIEIEKFKNKEKLLSLSNDHLRFILSESKTGSWEWNIKTNENKWSDEIWGLYGIEKHSCEQSYEGWKNTIIEEDRNKTEEQVLQASKKNIPFRIEWRIRHSDGSVHWLMTKGIPFKEADGNVSRYIGVVIDITEQKETEEALKESEERFRNFFERHSAVMMILDPETGNIVDVNDAAAEYYGWSKEELLRMSVLNLNIDNPDISRKRLKEWNTSEKRTFTVTHRKADGTVCDIEVFGKKLKSNNRWLAFLILHDITERKKFQEALLESNERMHFILDAAHAGMWETSVKTEENKWSDEIWPLFGIITDSCNPSIENWLCTIIPEDRPSVEQAFSEALQSHAEFNASWRIQNADGSIRWLLSKGSPVKDADGQVMKYAGIMLDITEQKRMEAEKMQLESRIRKSERLETLGNLAGGIAHDFNNILTPILGYAEMGMIGLSDQDPAHNFFKEITLAAERAKNLVYQILMFSKARETESASISVQAVIEEALKLLRASIPSSIEIEKQINQSCRNIYADPSKIYQVILNLCTNAFQAMENTGGTLTIEIDEIIPGRNLINKIPELHKQSYVLLTITDTGHGMDSKTLEHIFEPFFTTKALNKGTGLGLSVVHGIVTSYDGAIHVESKPEKGTSFHIYLPVNDKNMTSEKQQENACGGAKARILLVDDEKQALGVLNIMLTQCGHKVQAISSPSEAIECFRNSPQEYDLVVTDLTMPEMTGIKLASTIYSYRPELPVILMTGYDKDIDAKEKEKNNIVRTLTKPIKLNVIASAINEVIANGKTA